MKLHYPDLLKAMKRPKLCLSIKTLKNLRHCLTLKPVHLLIHLCFCMTTFAWLIRNKDCYQTLAPERITTGTMKYRRIFPVESLSKLENPWKEITLNRCILVAMIIVAVSSGIEKTQEVLETYFEETEDLGLELQAGDLSEESFLWWDTFAIWNWKSEDKIDEFKKKRAARLKVAAEKTGPRRIRNKALDEALLKEKEQSRIIPVIVQ